MKERLLRAKNLNVSFKGVKALNGASIDLDEGEIVALMGPNGAGKSTIIKSIFGLVDMQIGEIQWHEHTVKPKAHEMVERGIAYVPQGRQIFRDLTIRENLEIGGYILKSGKERKQRIEDVLEIFPDLKKKIGDKARSLSGGQQQMLALARGLMTDPKVLLLDEPTLGLAPKLVKQVFEKIKEINERRNTAILVVEHNIKSLLEISHRAYVLDQGSIVSEGSAQQIQESGILQRIFTKS